MKTQKLFPMSLFAEITRMDEDERIVSGYAFVNETVPGEGGLKLKRSAMEEATPDYMTWGNIREMHRSDSAAGTTVEGGWDEKGFFISAKIVDDAAWKKCKERVYKGFSVGVTPTVMRGKEITKVNFIEISLVDRPKDQDCPIKFIRTETVQQAEVEVIDEEETPAGTPAGAGGTGDDAPTGGDHQRASAAEYKRGTFADYQKAQQNTQLRYMAQGWLTDSLWDIAHSELDGNTKEQLARQSIAEYAEFVAPLCRVSNTLPDEFFAAAIGRTVSVDGLDPVTRVDTLKTRIEELETLNRDLEAKVARAAKTPAEPALNVVRSAQGVDRTILNDLATGGRDEGTAKALREEKQAIETELAGEVTQDRRIEGVTRVMAIEHQLRILGE